MRSATRRAAAKSWCRSETNPTKGLRCGFPTAARGFRPSTCRGFLIGFTVLILLVPGTLKGLAWGWRLLNPLWTCMEEPLPPRARWAKEQLLRLHSRFMLRNDEIVIFASRYG